MPNFAQSSDVSSSTVHCISTFIKILCIYDFINMLVDITLDKGWCDLYVHKKGLSTTFTVIMFIDER